MSETKPNLREREAPPAKEVPPPPELEQVLAPIEEGATPLTRRPEPQERIQEIMKDLKHVLPTERRMVGNPSLQVRELMGGPFYGQYVLIKDKRLSELMTKEEPSAWEKIKGRVRGLLGQEEERPDAGAQLALNKIGTIYASIKSPVEAYTAFGMTVEQFLIKYLKDAS